MTERPVVAACAFCGLTRDEVTLTGQSGRSAHICYDCLTLLACMAASTPEVRTIPDGPFATNRAAFKAFLREWDLPGGTTNSTAGTAQPEPDDVPDPAVKCSFCGKLPSQVTKMIAGPSAFICNECVALCNDIISEETAPT